MRKNILLALACLFCALPSWSQFTEVKYLSGRGFDDAVEWDFRVSGGRKSGYWTKIPVPSCWETEGFGTYNYGHDRDMAAETGSYKTSFTIPAGWRGKRIFIVFEGSMTDTSVKVNGRSAGPLHQGSFYAFRHEITKLVRMNGENLLEVEVSKMSANRSVNQAEREADFWIFGGIFRPVYLEAMPQKFIEYVSYDPRMDGTIRAEVNLYEPLDGFEAELTVTDAGGRRIGSVSGVHSGGKTKSLTLSGKIEGVEPWSAETPALYTATMTVKQGGSAFHEKSEKIGFRTVEVRQRDGIYINGAKMRFKGVNRHSFWPETGRTTNREVSIADGRLIKEMNMNAVRMSHYPPDKHFLEVCDSLGLYVIDELCAWQWPPYDTSVGEKLVREMITHDLNHPSIFMWANGNEGGFNFDLDPHFPALDIQKRPVIHPWTLWEGINTVHYIAYDSGIQGMFHGRDIFMPTELIHGLYDGGHGAGLDDFWNLMLDNPLSAGMFLWDFADQAVVRTDLGGILDTDKTHGADGIVGPYREKEGSFYTIKEIWSPVHIRNTYITPAWNKTFTVENRYDFTNTSQCSFSWELARLGGFSGEGAERVSGAIAPPDIEPGMTGRLKLELPAGWLDYDVLYLTAKGPAGEELFTWSFEITNAGEFAAREVNPIQGYVPPVEEESRWIFSAAGTIVAIDKATGMLSSVTADGRSVPLTGGRLITDRELECASVDLLREDAVTELKVVFNSGEGNRSRRAADYHWSMLTDGTLGLKVVYPPQDRVKMSGITFDFPDEDVSGARLISKGPYRVYNNRLKGGTLGVWDKKYNNTITGESWDYPEFKGYYANLYGARIEYGVPFEVWSATDDLFLHLFTPEPQKNMPVDGNFTLPEYPSGNLSFMTVIPAVGTKFDRADNYGPASQSRRFKGNGLGNNARIKLFFRFR